MKNGFIIQAPCYPLMVISTICLFASDVNDFDKVFYW